MSRITDGQPRHPCNHKRCMSSTRATRATNMCSDSHAQVIKDINYFGQRFSNNPRAVLPPSTIELHMVQSI